MQHQFSPATQSSGVTLHGLQIDSVTLETAAKRVVHLAAAAKPQLVVTPNTDHFLRWQDSSHFRELYKPAALTLADGAPLVVLARWSGAGNLMRVTGADLFERAAEEAAANEIPFIIVGGAPGVGDAAADALRLRYPGLRVPLVSVPSREEVDDPRWIADLARTLAKYPSKIVALCLGSPKQEALFAKLKEASPGGGAFLCVGAAVDFAAGNVGRAPMWMRRIGIEWMYRLLKEPGRLWRRYLVQDVRLLQYFLLIAPMRRNRDPAAGAGADN
ncbi:WecB/TagA/CpsF family glycosyltransferase [Microbacterium trichothecenolyticum]